MNVEEQKQAARALEQQGETEEALSLYEKILADLEGTPEIWRELPLYVKAGDLSLKLNDSSNAVSHYEKAANAYAAYGSSKSVIALCTKILRVNPGRTHVFLRLVRLMIEREHLADARLVLVEYAERLKLPKAALVLESLADKSEEEMKPLLEMLLELGGRYEYARAQGRDHAPEEDTAEEESHSEAETLLMDAVAPSGTADASAEEGSEQGLEPPASRAEAAGTDAAGQREPESVPPGDRDLDTEGDSSTEPLVPDEDDIQWVDDRPSVQMPIPRASRQVLFKEAEKRKRKPKALWIALGAAAVVVVGGLSLVLFDVIPLGGGEEDAPQETVPQPTLSDSALMAGVDLEDSTATEAEDTTAHEAVTTVPTLGPGERAARDTTDVPEAEQTPAGPEVEVPEDSVSVSEQATDVDTSSAQTAPEPPPSQGVMVQDFGVETATEFTVEGRVGYRITQLLGTGELLTLSAVYYGDDIASAPGSAEMTLTPLAGDTTTAIIQFAGYVVEARALVSASVLETLLSRLTEIPRSN